MGLKKSRWGSCVKKMASVGPEEGGCLETKGEDRDVLPSGGKRNSGMGFCIWIPITLPLSRDPQSPDPRHKGPMSQKNTQHKADWHKNLNWVAGGGESTTLKGGGGWRRVPAT